MEKDFYEQIRDYISSQEYGYEWFCILLGVFFVCSAIGNWNWVFDPPYNSVKNPIGYWYGRTAFRVTVFIFGMVLIVLSVFVILK